MQSGSKVDPCEQSTRSQLLSVTNTWKGKVTANIRTLPADKEDDNFCMTT